MLVLTTEAHAVLIFPHIWTTYLNNNSNQGLGPGDVFNVAIRMYYRPDVYEAIIVQTGITSRVALIHGAKRGTIFDALFALLVATERVMRANAEILHTLHERGGDHPPHVTEIGNKDGLLNWDELNNSLIMLRHS